MIETLERLKQQSNNKLLIIKNESFTLNMLVSNIITISLFFPDFTCGMESFKIREFRDKAPGLLFAISKYFSSKTLDSIRILCLYF